MKKKTVITLLCAGVLTAGAVAGLTGFADKKDDQKGSGEYTLLSMAEDDETEVKETEADENRVAEAEVDETEAKATGTITGVEDVAREVQPAVVSITNKSVQEVRDLFGMYGMYGFGWGDGRGRTYTYESESRGSGIIIGQNDSELLIATNYHVVEDATELTVGFVDDEMCKATVKGTDDDNDLAVVSVALSDIPDDTLSKIKVAKIGDSDDLVVGQQVVCIGNALGYGQSVTTGIVSALNRTIKLEGYDNTKLIQTDAAINGGNSGGAMLDMNGHVVGINSAKVASAGVEGMGYAIPISYAKPILEDLMNKKTRTEVVDEDQSAYIGFSGEEVSGDVAQLYNIPEGILVEEVAEGSPAEEAGMKKGDIIVKFDGEDVASMSDLREKLAYYAAGEEITVTVSRANEGEYEETKLELTLGAAE